MARQAEIKRNTAETQIVLNLNIDGQGQFVGGTGIGFFDHMLALFAKHALVDLSVTCKGDLQVDGHHTVEDVGLCLGQAILTAVGDKKGVLRYGQSLLPMDEVLVLCAVDLSGRPFLAYDLPVALERVGDFESDLTVEFFRAVAMSGLLNLHIKTLSAGNSHHMIEAAFKGFARALRMAVVVDARDLSVPSTKGLL